MGLLRLAVHTWGVLSSAAAAVPAFAWRRFRCFPHSTKWLVFVGSAVFGFALNLAVAKANQCLAPTSESELQRRVTCSSNALCCPRELEEQVNLVRTIATKLRSSGYTIARPDVPRAKWPDVLGNYNPTKDTPLREAMRHYARANGITLQEDRLSYQFVDNLLGRNLFERWKVK